MLLLHKYCTHQICSIKSTHKHYIIYARTDTLLHNHFKYAITKIMLTACVCVCVCVQFSVCVGVSSKV